MATKPTTTTAARITNIRTIANALLLETLPLRYHEFEPRCPKDWTSFPSYTHVRRTARLALSSVRVLHQVGSDHNPRRCHANKD